MAVVNGCSEGGKIAREICDALGLKNVRDLKIHFPLRGCFTVEAEFYPEIDGVRQFPAILRKFDLVPRIETEETTVMGDTVASFRLKETA